MLNYLIEPIILLRQLCMKRFPIFKMYRDTLMDFSYKKAIVKSKPVLLFHLAWTLETSISQLCRSLDIHRLSVRFSSYMSARYSCFFYRDQRQVE